MPPFELKDLPKNPGCYLYKDKKGKVIYVGKAKHIRKRVTQYFNRDVDAKTAQLVSNIASVDFFITDNESEALLLEARLIRSYRPQYNIDLKDNDTRYAYIEITKDEYPVLRTARRRSRTGEYYGPFMNGTARSRLIKTLTRLFKLRVCDKRHSSNCFYCHIGQCSGYPGRDISPEQYAKQVDQARQVLKGHTKELLGLFQKEMHKAAKSQHFELAKKRRDQIAALEYLATDQKVELEAKFNQDVFAYVRSSEKMVVVLFSFKKGTLLYKEVFELNPLESSDIVLEQLLGQWYVEHDIPGQILVQELSEIAQNTLAEHLSEKSGHAVHIHVPQRGTKKHLVDMVRKNAEFALLGSDQVLVGLQKSLRLPKLPAVIECFDISTLQGKETVASMVQFRDGKPDKDNYRRFKVRVEGQDDFASMQEVVYRRYYRLVNNQEPMPDLIMIDGGKGQLSHALDSLKKLDVTIPIISLAKKEEEVFVPGRSIPIRISKKKPELKLLQQIRDEAHRFAITYHRHRRDKMVFDQL